VIITISELKGEELIKNIHEGILRKLQSAKQLVDFDREISAGLYTYALEEFGKLLLVRESKSKNNQYEIKREWFRTHKDKFPKAFDYLQQNNHSQCIALTEGTFVISYFYWQDFMVGLLADFEARLSIFYTDFRPKGNNDVDIVKIPNVDRDMLVNAINEFEVVMHRLT
jgi:AbiV family abortive infection protein